MGHFSAINQKKIRHFIKRYCNDLDIKLVLSSFQIGFLFGVENPVADGLRSRVVLLLLSLFIIISIVLRTT